MKKISFYEFTGILAPGAVCLYGLARLIPDLGFLLSDKELSLGDFGLLLILAYITGHLLQSLGNGLEWVWWKLWGGWPSAWVRNNKHSLIAPEQRALLPKKIQDVLGIDCKGDLANFDEAGWRSIVSQVYAQVRKAGRAGRVDIFNGNYGMFRGIATSIGILVLAYYTSHSLITYKLGVVLWVLFALALIRMHRFGKYYASELFIQFLDFKPGETPSKTESE